MKLTIKDVSALLRDIKANIEDDMIGFDDTLPSIEVTLAADVIGLTELGKNADFALQTGNNSFFGVAYGYDTWAVGTLYRRTNTRDLARDLIDELFDMAAEYDSLYA